MADYESWSTEKLRAKQEKLTEQRAALAEEAKEVGGILRERELDESADSALQGLSDAEIARLAERAQVAQAGSVKNESKVGSVGG